MKVKDHEGQSSPRWAFMNGFQVRKHDQPYLDRLRLVQTPYFGLFLHRIHMPDSDRDPHDHPWPFWSLILSGGYTERVWANGSKARRGFRNDAHSVERRHSRWSLHRMPVSRAHKILTVEGRLWTLVLTGRRRRSWGFWTPEGPVNWKIYLDDPESGVKRPDEDLAIWGGRG